MDRVNPYYAFYAAQQQGAGSTLPYYRSRFRIQAGRGWFGSLMRSAWNYLRPLASSAAKHAGAAAFNVGSNMMKEVVANPNESMKDVIMRQGTDGLTQIAKAALTGARQSVSTQSGKGRRGKHRQSASRRRQAKVAPARRSSSIKSQRGRRQRRSQPLPNASSIRDIFSPPSP